VTTLAETISPPCQLFDYRWSSSSAFLDRSSRPFRFGSSPKSQSLCLFLGRILFRPHYFRLVSRLDPHEAVRLKYTRLSRILTEFPHLTLNRPPSTPCGWFSSSVSPSHAPIPSITMLFPFYPAPQLCFSYTRQKPAVCKYAPFLRFSLSEALGSDDPEATALAMIALPGTFTFDPAPGLSNCSSPFP